MRLVPGKTAVKDTTPLRFTVRTGVVRTLLCGSARLLRSITRTFGVDYVQILVSCAALIPADHIFFSTNRFTRLKGTPFGAYLPRALPLPSTATPSVLLHQNPHHLALSYPRCLVFFSSRSPADQHRLTFEAPDAEDKHRCTTALDHALRLEDAVVVDEAHGNDTGAGNSGDKKHTGDRETEETAGNGDGESRGSTNSSTASSSETATGKRLCKEEKVQHNVCDKTRYNIRMTESQRV